MQDVIVAMVIALAIVGWFALGAVAQKVRHDPDEDAAYAELQRAGVPMSRAAFSAIREENRKDKEQFGDGRHAPHWPKYRWNGHSTLRRGVWVDDSGPIPSDDTLDAFRDNYWKTHRVVKFTLIEGEQVVPLGKNGAMIRVRASSGHSSTIADASGRITSVIPTVSISPVDREAGWLGSSHMGTLPADMSVVVEVGATDAIEAESRSR